MKSSQSKVQVKSKPCNNPTFDNPTFDDDFFNDDFSTMTTDHFGNIQSLDQNEFADILSKKTCTSMILCFYETGIQRENKN
jgi:hypothetical protein